MTRPRLPVLPETPPRGPSAEPPEAQPVRGKAYWRSVERLLDSPAIQEQEAAGYHQRVGEEFPVGASDAPEGVSRRTMLSVMGASFALAAGAGCRRPETEIVPYVQAPETHVPGRARLYATTMTLGTQALGVLAESHQGRPTTIDGNDLHPAARGAAGVWAQASILDLYDPDRSRGVVSGRSGALAASSWDDFAAAWGEIAAGLAEDGGASLAVIIGAFASPTRARLLAALRERYPQARIVVHEPAGDGNVFAGLRRATGRPQAPAYDLAAARVIAALDADLLGGSLEAAGHGKGWAAGRRAGADGGAMNRLYAVESTLTVTGANADHRLRLPRRHIGGFVAALAEALGTGAAGLSSEGLSEEARAKAGVLAEDLRSAGSAALVAAGPAQPPAVHAAVYALNQVLGAADTTVRYRPLEAVAWDDPEAGGLQELAETLRAQAPGEAGGIRTVVALGTNPAYTGPGELKLARRLGEVETLIHLGGHRDETGHLATWHLPEAHYLEAWGDAVAADGTASLVQPLIEPLYGAKSALELLGLMASGELRSGYELVRETHGAGDSGEPLEAWRTALHDGIVPETGAAPLAAVAETAADAASPAAEPGENPAATDDGLEVTFHPSPAVYDGRFANNGWLQELPDPITKVTWDNAALVSPATAQELGVERGSILTLTVQGQKLTVPVFVLPGQADGSIALELGFGRTDAGRVANGVGFSAYRVRPAASPWTAAVRVSSRRGHHELVQTQEHWSLEGRTFVREATVEEYAAHPDFAHEPDKHHPPLGSMWEDNVWDEGYQWGMAIDLNTCIGCNACAVACQAENNVPIVGREQVNRGREMHWLRVDRYFTGSPEDPEVVFQPLPCMHCENAPCEQVCPVAATVHDSEGLNVMVYNRCIGTRYCSNNCPYKVRRFNFFNYTKDTPEVMELANNPDVTVRSRGVMEKCTYCTQRIQEAKFNAKRAGRPVLDGEVRTACQQTCPTDAIVFGDVNDPETEVSRWKADERDYVLLGELNNRPRTSYLAKLRNPNPAWSEA